MRYLRCGWLVLLYLAVFAPDGLQADPVADANPRVSIEGGHLTLTFDQHPGPDLYIVEISDELAQ